MKERDLEEIQKTIRRQEKQKKAASIILDNFVKIDGRTSTTKEMSGQKRQSINENNNIKETVKCHDCPLHEGTQ